MFLSYGNLVCDLLTELRPVEWVNSKKPKRRWPKTSKKIGRLKLGNYNLDFEGCFFLNK